MHLPAFQQSVFLQSLGWAIANSIWQSALLFVLYKIIVSSYKNSISKFKYNLGTALLFSSFLWFITTFFSRFFHLFTADTSTYGPVKVSKETIINGNVSLQDFFSPLITALPYFSLAYISLLLIFLIKLINSCSNIRFIMSNGLSKPGAEWRVFVDKVANQIYINKKIKIWFSRYVDVPATIGFLKPIILVPLASVNQLTTTQMEAIILHEICHIKSNDYLINLFIACIETLLFFNPFVILLGRIIKKERENCCDDFVLQYQYDRHSYATALLVLERSRKQQLILALTATCGHKPLLQRIKRIMEVRNTIGDDYGQKLFALILSAGIIGSISFLTPEKKINQDYYSAQISFAALNTYQPPVPPVHPPKKKSVINSENTLNNPVVPFARLNDEGLNAFKPVSKAIKINKSNALSLKISLPVKSDLPGNISMSIESVSASQKPVSVNQTKAARNEGTFIRSLFSDLKSLEDFPLNFKMKLKEGFEKDLEAFSIYLFDNQHFSEANTQFNYPEIILNTADDKAICPPGEGKFTNKQQKDFDKQLFNADNLTQGRRVAPRQRDTFLFFMDNNRTGIFINNDVKHTDVPPIPTVSKKTKIATSSPNSQPNISYNFTFNSAPPKLNSPTDPSVHVNRKEESSININGKKIILRELKKNQVERLIKNLIKENSKSSIEI